MNERIIWFDPDEWPDALGVMLHGGMARLAGAEICASPAKDRETELTQRLAEKGFHFIYEGDETAFPWYALPRLHVFASDGAGFYATDEPAGVESEGPVWRVDAEGRVSKAAESVRALIEAVLAGEALTQEPDEDHRLFASRRDAEKTELFLRNDTPWHR